MVSSTSAVGASVNCDQAARRRGKREADVQRNLEELESILPGLVNLHRMPAKDWVSMCTAYSVTGHDGTWQA